jgi:hypothetical protein
VRAWLTWALAAGCSSGPDCRIETVIADRIGKTAVSDCGSVAVDAADADFQTAHDCAAAAIAASESFTVEWEIDSLDGHASGAYIGLADATGYTTFALSFHDPHPSTTTERCARLVDLGDCGLLHTSLCMACTQGHPDATCPKQ